MAHRKQRHIPPPDSPEPLASCADDPAKQVGWIQQMIAYCEKHGIGVEAPSGSRGALSG
jgi:hypothetical protein